MLRELTAMAVVTAVALAAMGIYVARRAGSRAGVSLAVMLSSVAWWATAYAMELSTTGSARGLWGDLKYAGIVVLSPAWLVFVLRYTGRDSWVTRRRIAALGIEPVLVGIVLALPATHDLIRYYRPGVQPGAVPVIESGPLFWVVFGYGNAVLVVATVLFVRAMAALPSTYRVAATVMVTAALVPWMVNVLYNLDVGRFGAVDMTPFAFILTGAVLVWGLYRERLINLSSVAWSAVIEAVADGVILCDAFGTVSDANPAALRVLGQRRRELVGRPLDAILPGAVAELSADNGPGAGDPRVTFTGGDGLTRHVEVRRQDLSVPSGARRAGELVLLRDVTERTVREQEFRSLLTEQTRIATVLQSSLVPALLPPMGDVLVAGVYQPAGSGLEVGGDFYDVFRIDAHRWGVMLGDVSGKGASAAALTGLVRYTVRALAMLNPRPAQVLHGLNDVLLREGEDERYCTVAFAVAQEDHDGIDLTLALGGHHQPLHRSSDGQVRAVGVPGTAIGLIDEPTITETLVQLRQGELLCMYTDGLVEARRDGVFFGDERLSALLSTLGGATPAPVLDAIANAVHHFRGGALEDDLALLAMGLPSRPAVQ
jgi:PAS domain S-box-containing protein